MMEVVDLELVGGPQDGLRVRIVPCTTFSVDAVRLSTGLVTRDVYALEVRDGGFCLRYLSSQTEPVA